MSLLGRKRSDGEKEPRGEGPDVAQVGGGWIRRGEHKPLSGGAGLFKYTDSTGREQTTHRFRLLAKSSDDSPNGSNC